MGSLFFLQLLDGLLQVESIVLEQVLVFDELGEALLVQLVKFFLFFFVPLELSNIYLVLTALLGPLNGELLGRSCHLGQEEHLGRSGVRV